MIGKIKYILILLVFYSCGYDDCADDVNDVNKKYDTLIEELRQIIPVDEEQIKIFNSLRGEKLAEIDC